MEILYLIIALLIAITIHEFSHAYTADRLGDPTPRLAGRLTLNPLKHLDILGTIMIFLVHFGWGKPIPINPRYFRKPISYSALTALAGPISNFLLAIFFAVLLKYIWQFLPEGIFDLFMWIININLALGIFNIIPLPPLDGSKIVGLIIPNKYHQIYLKFLINGPVYLVILIAADYFLISRWFGFSIFGYVIGNILEYLRAVIFLGA